MILGVIACVVAGCALWLSATSFIRSSDFAKKGELPALLSQSAEAQSKDYERRLRLIEVEWDNMYQKFSKLIGRADRQRALDSPPPAKEIEHEPVALTRSDILRRYKRQ